MRGSRLVGATVVALVAITTSTPTAGADGTGGTPVTAAASAAPAPPPIRVTATVRLTRSQTRSVQRRVHVRADGRAGRQTHRAIRRYQTRKGLMRTSRPNLQTLRAMRLRFAERIAARMTRKAAATVATGSGVFPIQGPWRYGGSGTAFGSRGGDHQGIDLLASCGTPVVAASPGRVKTRRSQSRAGHYVVLTGTPTGEDQVYMHLTSASPLRVGDPVAAGTAIGTVGDTGRASACHLHLELWTAPGWYAGGRPHDPRPSVQAWAAAAGNPAQPR